jgi:hypothetical protein
MDLRRDAVVEHALRPIALALVCLLVVACPQGAGTSDDDAGSDVDAHRPVLALGGSRQPYIPQSWTVAAWFVDPSNSSAAASDNNTCTTSGAPCLTYAEIAARWGTYSPRLRQSTTITFLSSHTDNTDPVYFKPYLENAATVIITGTLTQVASVTLGSVTAKTRATPQLLQANLGASGAIDQLLINTTRASSRAWVYKLVSGTTFSISQPLAVQTPPLNYATGIGSAENNAWANGDTVTLNTLSAVNLADVEPILTDLAPSFTRQLYITSLKVFDPSSNDFLTVNQNVKLFDVLSARGLGVFSAANTFTASGAYNVDLKSNFVKPACGGPFAFVGGIASGSTTEGCTFVFDGDTILNTSPVVTGLDNTTPTFFNLAFIESGKVLGPQGGVVAVASEFVTGGPIIWGPGAVRVSANAHLRYPAGANQAVAVFIHTGAFQVNGATTACSHTSAAPDVVNCGITVSAANLDAAAGAAGFGGNAFLPGGASISNF